MSELIGNLLSSYLGVPAYQNGPIITMSHGKNYASDGYYYGQKWQCVEYVKRFYHDALGHSMPDVWGHACDFFDPQVVHGQLNKARNLWQFQNGGDIPPAENDLLVFQNGGYGHVAIITRVSENVIEVIQQNIFGKARQTHPLQKKEGRFHIGTSQPATGWLRSEPS